MRLIENGNEFSVDFSPNGREVQKSMAAFAERQHEVSKQQLATEIGSHMAALFNIMLANSHPDRVRTVVGYILDQAIDLKAKRDAAT